MDCVLRSPLEQLILLDGSLTLFERLVTTLKHKVVKRQPFSNRVVTFGTTFDYLVFSVY